MENHFAEVDRPHRDTAAKLITNLISRICQQKGICMKKIYCLTVLCLIFFLNGCSAARLNIFDGAPNPLQEYTLEGKGKDKILVIPINGSISDSPQKGIFSTRPSLVEQVVIQLNKARLDSQIKAVVLKVNSSGGTVTASDILYHEISGYKETTGNKITVAMMDLAASGAYYLSLPADMIMAHPTTLTGSIGVIFIRPKVTGLMDKIGVGVEIDKYGRNKDMGSPFRETNAEEKELMQKKVDQFGKRFIDLVNKHRRLDPKALETISTARIFTADEALPLKLIDKIGYLNDAIAETKKLAGLADNTRVVVYRRASVPEDNYYNSSGMAIRSDTLSALSIELPEIFSPGPGFYYLWPGAINFE